MNARIASAIENIIPSRITKLDNNEARKAVSKSRAKIDILNIISYLIVWKRDSIFVD